MTEYWKSQARKYCEFCKCWFADNKVSISFHENGKRHKENVQKHISKLTKKSTKDAKRQEKMDDDIMKMETAAMAAYLKDVKNNADLTSQNINEMIGNGSGESKVSIVAGNAPHKKSPPVWNEVRNEVGSSYFWNTETNDTTWIAPDEYLSIEQQDNKKLTEGKADKKNKIMQKEQEKEAIKERNAHMAREKMRELAVKKDVPKPQTGVSNIQFGPEPRASKPYGSWTPIVNKTEDKVDLQLPKPGKELPPPPVVVVPETVQFKEKRVESLGDGPVEFKKRKINNSKRNMRQKVEDD